MTFCGRVIGPEATSPELFLAALCGWALAEASAQRGRESWLMFCWESMEQRSCGFSSMLCKVSVQDIVVFLFSLFGVAALPALARLLMGHGKRWASARLSQPPILMKNGRLQFALDNTRPSAVTSAIEGRWANQRSGAGNVGLFSDG